MNSVIKEAAALQDCTIGLTWQQGVTHYLKKAACQGLKVKSIESYSQRSEDFLWLATVTLSQCSMFFHLNLKQRHLAIYVYICLCACVSLFLLLLPDVFMHPCVLQTSSLPLNNCSHYCWGGCKTIWGLRPREHELLVYLCNFTLVPLYKE